MSSQLLSNFKLFSANSMKGSTAIDSFETSPYDYKWIVALCFIGMTAFFYMKREDIKIAFGQLSTAANMLLVKWWVAASAGEWKTTYVPSDFFSTFA